VFCWTSNANTKLGFVLIAAQAAGNSQTSNEQGEAGGGEQLATAGSDELAMDDGFSDLIAQLMELQQDPAPSSTTPLPEPHPFV
jgi:hypothetical protein